MKKGFTLIETLIALTVTALAVVTLQFGFQAMAVKTQQRTDEQLAWYHFLATLESDQYQFTLNHQELQSVHLTPHVADNDLDYGMYFHAGKIVLTTQQGGYMPLLNNLHYAEFGVRDGFLTIKVTTRNYQHLSAVTAVGGYHD